MAGISIRLAESALADLEAIRTWYRKQRVSEIGERFVAEILARIEGLQQQPDIGRMVPEFEQPFLRELIHPPFRIVYRREAKQVRIVRIWRSERQLILQ